jgi:antitoxin PrlF
MATATMTSKGQITVPKEVRDDLNLVPGSKVMFVKLRGGQYRLIARTGHVNDFIGMLHDSEQRPLTIDEINEAIADGGAASGMRGLEH